MSPRLRHAARFALPTLATVLAMGAVWETLDVFLIGDVPSGVPRGEVFAFNVQTWATLAVVEAVVVFLLRVSDVQVRPPSWRFAWIAALWLGTASLVVGHAVESGRLAVALFIALLAAVIWLTLHRWIPGWPGRAPLLGDAPRGASQGDRDLR